MSPERAVRRPVVIYGDAFADRAGELQRALGPDFPVTALPTGRPLAERQAMLDSAFAVVAVGTDPQLPFPPSIALVQVPGIGWDSIDLAQLSAATPLANVGGHETGVAEYCMAQMLEWRHRLGPAAASFRAGSWERSSRYGALPHCELAGATAGIVGYGAIGRALARRLAAFEVRVLASNRSPLADAAPLDRLYPLAETAAMLAQCDFGIVAIALTPDTEGLIGAPELAALGADGVLINVARGPVVAEAPLWQALDSGRLGGAILDVWYRYPDAGDPDRAPAAFDFAALPNVVMTPHVSGWTDGTASRRIAFIARNIHRVAAGEPALNIVATGSRA